MSPDNQFTSNITALLAVIRSRALYRRKRKGKRLLRQGFQGCALFTQSAIDIGAFEARKVGGEQPAISVDIVAMSNRANFSSIVIIITPKTCSSFRRLWRARLSATDKAFRREEFGDRRPGRTGLSVFRRSTRAFLVQQVSAWLGRTLSQRHRRPMTRVWLASPR